MVFILPERPRKPHWANEILDEIKPSIMGLVADQQRGKLEQQLQMATTPEERSKAIDSIMLSKHFGGQEKGSIEKMLHQERAQAQQNQMLQSIFGDNSAGMQPSLMPREMQSLLQEQLGAQGQGQQSQDPMQQQQQPQQQQQQQPQGGFLDHITNEKLAQLSMINPQLATQLQRMKEGEQKMRDAEQAREIEEYKLREPLEKEMYEKKKSAQNSLRSLENLERLNEKGDMNNPVFAQMADKLGAKWALTADTIEFKKTVIEELSNLKAIFGARPSIFDVQTYLEGMPTTDMTQDSRRKLIERKKQLAQASMIEHEAYVLAKKEKADPTTLRERASEKADQMIDEYMHGLKQQWQVEDGRMPKQKAGGVRMKAPDGKVYIVPDAKVKEMEAKGGKVVG